MKTKGIVLLATIASMEATAIANMGSPWLNDIIFSAALATAAFLLYEKLRMTPFIFSMVCLSLLVHDLGAFGFYADPPLLSIPYDDIVHFLGIFSGTLLTGNLICRMMKKTKTRFSSEHLILLLLIFLSGLGIGILIELLEFFGYMIFGAGEGAFMFGAGDGSALCDMESITGIIGGGYFDTMEDHIYNTLGALTSTVLIGLNSFFFQKKGLPLLEQPGT
jgi:uncharacterized membrane protein YjdF